MAKEGFKKATLLPNALFFQSPQGGLAAHGGSNWQMIIYARRRNICDDWLPQRG